MIPTYLYSLVNMLLVVISLYQDQDKYLDGKPNPEKHLSENLPNSYLVLFSVKSSSCKTFETLL